MRAPTWSAIPAGPDRELLASKEAESPQRATRTRVKELLENPTTTPALIVGNGVNRYGVADGTNSWHDLLISLAAAHLPDSLRQVPKGVTLTEFFDVLDLTSGPGQSGPALQKAFCGLMESWQYFGQHERIVAWARRNAAPILTTNFETTLADAGNCRLFRNKKHSFTDYYPWESYYSTHKVEDPSRQFAIWHVNGMQRYRRSVRLGLSHYMGSVERARSWIYREGEKRLFSKRGHSDWAGCQSWLHVVFNCPLILFGLALDETEVFLRWLLIERARYFKTFKGRSQPAWYVHPGPLRDAGKAFFLQGIGVTPYEVSSYAKIYGKAVWQ